MQNHQSEVEDRVGSRGGAAEWDELCEGSRPGGEERGFRDLTDWGVLNE